MAFRPTRRHFARSAAAASLAALLPRGLVGNTTASKKALLVTLVNPRHDVDMEVDCALRGVTARQGRAQILHDPDLNACNSFEQPELLSIKPHSVAVEGGRLRITLPSLSVAAVTLEVAS